MIIEKSAAKGSVVQENRRNCRYAVSRMAEGRLAKDENAHYYENIASAPVQNFALVYDREYASEQSLMRALHTKSSFDVAGTVGGRDVKATIQWDPESTRKHGAAHIHENERRLQIAFVDSMKIKSLDKKPSVRNTAGYLQDLSVRLDSAYPSVVSEFWYNEYTHEYSFRHDRGDEYKTFSFDDVDKFKQTLQDIKEQNSGTVYLTGNEGFGLPASEIAHTYRDGASYDAKVGNDYGRDVQSCHAKMWDTVNGLTGTGFERVKNPYASFLLGMRSLISSQSYVMRNDSLAYDITVADMACIVSGGYDRVVSHGRENDKQSVDRFHGGLSDEEPSKTEEADKPRRAWFAKKGENGAERVFGTAKISSRNGKTFSEHKVSMKRDFGSHSFSDAELDDLFAGKQIELKDYVTKSGKKINIKGSLGEIDFNGRKTYGFVRSDIDFLKNKSFGSGFNQRRHDGMDTPQ